jgi:hypothetical protein
MLICIKNIYETPYDEVFQTPIKCSLLMQEGSGGSDILDGFSKELSGYE